MYLGVRGLCCTRGNVSVRLRLNFCVMTSVRLCESYVCAHVVQGFPCTTEQGKRRQVEHVDGECCFQRGVQHVRRRGHRPLRPSRRRRPCARTRNPPRHHFAQGEDCHGCSWRTVGFYIPVSQYKSVYPTSELQSVVFLSCGIFMSHFCFVYRTLMTDDVRGDRGKRPGQRTAYSSTRRRGSWWTPCTSSKPTGAQRGLLTAV